MPEYASICLYKQILNMSCVPNMPKFWIWESSEYGRALNMLVLHSLLDMPEYALTEF